MDILVKRTTIPYVSLLNLIIDLDSVFLLGVTKSNVAKKKNNNNNFLLSFMIRVGNFYVFVS